MISSLFVVCCTMDYLFFLLGYFVFHVLYRYFETSFNLFKIMNVSSYLS